MLLPLFLPLIGALTVKGDFFQLDSLSNMSRYYLNYVYCNIWEEECRSQQEDPTIQVPTGDFWSSLTADYIQVLSELYCSFGQCCDNGDCRILNNVTGLERDLEEKLHGQHLAKEVVVNAVRGFLKNSMPEKALALSFHGWSGTGKNFVGRMIAENLYRGGVKNECVRLYIAPFHFPHAKLLDVYRVQLMEGIKTTVQNCQQALFIFDEAEKMHPGLLDTIKPYMDYYDNVDGTDFRKSIFIFLSNIGGSAINELALDIWHSGQDREDIAMDDLEPRLRNDVLESQGGFSQSRLVSGNLIDFFVPFLPMEYRHVKLCARDAFRAREVDYTEQMLDEVAKGMVYFPKEEKLFSTQGCKSVPQRISFFLP
ncbi:torsin-3A [Polypterus senegalus]|uniref:torsin-3A n=1 Tax=Polypterus senegalus TaxID=55291 RepID=UPI0019629E42|nr:torsin-3A [Polypterus senegalus]